MTAEEMLNAREREARNGCAQSSAVSSHRMHGRCGYLHGGDVMPGQ